MKVTVDAPMSQPVFLSKSCLIRIVCREITGKESLSQYKRYHRKIAELEGSLGQNLDVMSDEKEAVLRDESIINNEKNCNTFCRLILAANKS
ncbi:hypothetical protein GLOIN_2v1594863 [Rhizophagus irregularis DAOM 181602=DAOM 197198]|nr:hypothetical protein GLOIN_2v1594863 [Rhizophagus irregularis DAOM 181602=DAOM 197198]